MLKNILSHEDTVVEFPRGFIAIVGPNGAGKSTLIDSIVYALLYSGKGPSGIRGGRKADLLRKGATYGEIVVDFEVGGKLFRVKRRLGLSRPEEAELYEIIDGKEKLLSRGIEQTYKTVLSILRVPTSEALRASIISRQDELTTLIESIPSKRKQLILQLLGLEELEKARELLGEEVRRLAIERGRYLEVEKNLNRRRQQLQEIEREREKLQNEIKALEERRNKLAEKLAEMQRKFELIEKFTELTQLYELVTDKRKYEEKYRCLRKALKALDRVAHVEIDYFEKLLKEYQDVKRRWGLFRQRLNATLEKLSKLVGGKIEERVSETFENKYKELLIKEHRMKAELEILKNSLQVLRDSSRCPICGRVLEQPEISKISNETRERIQRLLQELDKIDSLKKNVEVKIKLIKNLENDLMRLEGSLEEIESRAKELEEKLKPLASQVMELYDSLKRVAESKDELCEEERSKINGFVRQGCLAAIKETKRLLENLRGMCSSIEEMLTEISKKLTNVSEEDVVKQYNELKRKLTEMGINVGNVRELYAKLKLGIEHLKTELMEVEKNLERLNSREQTLLEHYEKLVKEVDELSKEVYELKARAEVYELIEFLRSGILGKDGEIAKRLTIKARTILERVTNEVLSHLGMSMRVRITPDFEIVVRNELGEIPVKNISGGEKTALSIAMRIALAYAVLGRMPSFFILDEPTAHLDEERRRGLFDMIKRISGRLPQVIVVTHDREVIEIADYVYEVFKEGSRSHIRAL